MFIQTVTNKKIHPFHAIAEFPDQWGNVYQRSVRQGGFATKKAAIASLKNKVGHVSVMVGGKVKTVYLKTKDGIYEI